MKKKKDVKKIHEFYSGIKFIKQVLLISLDLYKNKTDNNINYNVIIQDYLVTKEYKNMIRYMFSTFNDSYHPKKLLYDCIELLEVVRYD